MSTKSIKATCHKVFVLLTLLLRVHGSTIATFTDERCRNSYKSINAENGYPNGTCSSISSQGSFGSFQVTGLDPGCTATIYANDTDPEVPCSSTVLEFARLAGCYNASWIWYSIDACTIPGQEPTPSATSTPRRKNTGAIAGGSVGGVIGLALIVAIAFFVVRHRKKRAANEGQHEVAGSALTELPPESTKPEIYTHQMEPQELGRHSVHVAPVELEGHESMNR